VLVATGILSSCRSIDCIGTFYGVYWNLFTPAEWEAKSAEHLAEQEKQRKLEAATVATRSRARCNLQRDFNFRARFIARPRDGAPCATAVKNGSRLICLLTPRTQ
jgi:hypothetical protein